MPKIYARQIPPEYQESPLFIFGYDGTIWENVVLSGNSYFTGHTIPLYDAIVEHYDDAAEDLENIKHCTDFDRAYFKNATEIINFYFPAMDYKGRPYSTRDIHNIRAALELYGTRRYYDGDYIPLTMEAITGHPWRERTLHGDSQGDWIKCIFQYDEISETDLEILEIEYFNTGSEWIIHDGENPPDGPDDIRGYSCYCYKWKNDEIRAELASIAETEPENVVMFACSGSHITYEYTEVSA